MFMQIALFNPFYGWVILYIYIHTYIYIYIHIYINSSVHGHLACFYVLAIVNIAAVNIGVHVPF